MIPCDRGPIVIEVTTVHDWVWWLQSGLQLVLVVAALALIGLLITAWLSSSRGM